MHQRGMSALSSLRAVLGVGALVTFLTAAVPVTLKNSILLFSWARQNIRLSAAEARSDLLGAAYVQRIEEIRRLIPEDGAYFLVDGGTRDEGSPLWARYELAPRRALLLGDLSGSRPRHLRWARRHPLPWVVIAYPPPTPARVLPRQQFLAEMAGRPAR